MLIWGVNQSVCLSRCSSCFHQQQQCVNELLLRNGANESCSSLYEMNTKRRKHSRTTGVKGDVAAATWELTAEHLKRQLKKQPHDSDLVFIDDSGFTSGNGWVVYTTHTLVNNRSLKTNNRRSIKHICWRPSSVFGPLYIHPETQRILLVRVRVS